MGLSYNNDHSISVTMSGQDVELYGRTVTDWVALFFHGRL